MIRNLKSLGVAVVAILAMSSVVASAASAEAKYLTEGATTLTGTQEVKNELSAPAGVLKCNKATFSGTAPAEASHATVTPAYSECTLAGAAATIDVNGCTYTFETPTKTEAPTTYHASVELVCPLGKKIEATAPTCTIDVSPQTLHSVVDLHNIGVGATREIIVTSTVEPTAVQTGTKCLGNGGAAEKAVTTKLTGTVKVTGEHGPVGGTTHTGIWVA